MIAVETVVPQERVLVAQPAVPLAVFAVADTLRDSSIEAIRELHRQGVSTVMLTGDNPTTASTIVSRAGIDEVRANHLPEEKLAAIDELIAQHGVVGMVGAGINDAPALTKSSVSFAMGVGR